MSFQVFFVNDTMQFQIFLRQEAPWTALQEQHVDGRSQFVRRTRKYPGEIVVAK